MNNQKVELKQRDSSIELLRIFAIFIIIVNHYALYSGFDISNKTAFSTILPLWLHMGGALGVNIFVFISGYFLCQRKKFKLNKLVSLTLEVLFYSIITVFIGRVFLKNIRFMRAIKMIFAIPSGKFQFVTMYVMLYILSPWINKFLENISLKSLFKLLLILTFTWVICPSITSIVNLDFDFYMNYSLPWFIYLYLLAAFIRRIEHKIPHKPKKYLFIGILSIVVIAITEVLIGYAGVYVNRIFARNEEVFRQYNSILIVIGMIFFFLGFKQCKIKDNKFINKIASTSLGVYILHESDALRMWLWRDVFRGAEWQYTNVLVLHAIYSCLVIFIVFAVVDLLRQKFIEKPIMKRLDKHIDKVQETFNKKIEKLSKKFES